METKVLRQIILNCRDDKNKVTPAAVVKAAADPNHPLHLDPGFHWGDNDKAAEQWRLEYADRLIRRVYITRRETTKSTTTRIVKMFVRDPDAPAKVAGRIAIGVCEDDVTDGFERPELNRSQSRKVLRNESARIIGCLHRAVRIARALEQSDTEKLLGSALKIMQKVDDSLQDGGFDAATG